MGGITTQPLRSHGSPKEGTKIRSGCLTPAFSGAQKWAEVPCNPCVLGGSLKEGTKSESAASPLPSRGPKKGGKCYVNPAFSRVPKKGDKITSGYLTPRFSGAHKWAEVLRNPSVLRGPQKRGQNQKWLPHPCPAGAAANQCVTLRGVRPFWGLYPPPPGGWVLTTTSPRALPSRGLKSGRRCYVTPAFSRSFGGSIDPPKKLETRHPLPSHVDKMATSPLPSRGLTILREWTKSEMAT